MSFLGLDPEAVNTLAVNLHQSADTIQQIMTSLTQQLNGAQWTGPDRDRFVNEWQSQHVAQLHSVINGLQQASTAASRNARDQVTTSNA
jgi:uncharacterized protein YukE